MSLVHVSIPQLLGSNEPQVPRPEGGLLTFLSRRPSTAQRTRAWGACAMSLPRQGKREGLPAEDSQVKSC